ncbi:MAG: AI-2E family transporter [Vicinamibacterales bacterium]
MDDDAAKSLKPWVTFAGCVLVIGILYWAQGVLRPFALAILLTFVLSPPVTWLQRWIGRAPAVLVVVTLVFTLLGLAVWGIERQIEGIVTDLPTYRTNILAKIADVRGVGRGGSMERLQKMIDDITKDLTGEEGRPGVVQTVVIRDQFASGFSWLGPVIAPLGTAGLVIAMVIFMLLERQDLRDRLIGLFGHGRLAVTTKAFYEAGSRVSRQLMRQALVNVFFGTVAGLMLYVIGVPYAYVWGALGAIMRFVPYVGGVVGAGVPILVSLATLQGWTGPLMVIGGYIVLEIVTNMVLETILYAGAAGVSQVALLASVAFWTWLWGPLGLLMATPLTVCLVVLGKHVQGLEFLATLMADTPALAPEYGYYQRLLARDQDEAAELVERHIRTDAPHTVFDALLLPALNYAERDRMEGRLSPGEEANVVEATGELTTDAADLIRQLNPAVPLAADTPLLAPREPLRVLGYATKGIADQLALRMLSHLVEDLPIQIEITKMRMQAPELIQLVRERAVSVVCLADLPPSASSKTRYLVKRLRQAFPEARLLVGRWGPEVLGDEGTQPLRVAGANHIGNSLVETRDELAELIELPRKKVLEAKSSAGIVLTTPPPATPQPVPAASVPRDPEITSIVK